MLQGPIVLFAKRKKEVKAEIIGKEYKKAQLATLKIIHNFLNTSNTKHMSMNESLVHLIEMSVVRYQFTDTFAISRSQGRFTLILFKEFCLAKLLMIEL